MFGMHCMAHRTNLTIQTLLKLTIVFKIDDTLQHMCSYFCHSSKYVFEYKELADIVCNVGNMWSYTSGNCIQCNVRTRWIRTLSPTKRVFGEYKPLFLKMYTNYSQYEASLWYRALAWFGMFNALALVFEQSHLILYNLFVCDFVIALKLCHGGLFAWYCDHACTFNSHVFLFLLLLLSFFF